MLDAPAQIRVASLLMIVACVAVNIWLFRIGPFWGILGLAFTKHILVAYLCQVVGLDRDREPAPIQADSANP